MSKNLKYINNLSELARIERVSRSTASRWNAAGHVARSTDGRIDLPATRRLVREGLRDPGTAAARRRLLEAKAGREELKLSAERGELLPREGLERALSAVLGAVRNRILAIGKKLPMRVLGCGSLQEIEGIINEMHCEALSELANFDVLRCITGAEGGEK